jgi:hypothetical protein
MFGHGDPTSGSWGLVLPLERGFPLAITLKSPLGSNYYSKPIK